MATTSLHTEAVLLAKIAEGDRNAFRQIYDLYWDRLLSVAINRLSNEAEAEECVQDVFLSLWQRRDTLVLKYSLSTYLWVAVKYQVINRLSARNAKKSLKTTELKEEIVVGAADEQLLEKELWERIEQVVSALPEKCQMVYRLSREQGKSNREIAGELDISEKTVEGHLTRALKDIRTNLNTIAPFFVIYPLIQDIADKLKQL